MVLFMYSKIEIFCDCGTADIDECGMDGACDQTCTNTDGSFVCSCDSGYALDGNGRDCNGTYLNMEPCGMLFACECFFCRY